MKTLLIVLLIALPFIGTCQQTADESLLGETLLGSMENGDVTKITSNQSSYKFNKYAYFFGNVKMVIYPGVEIVCDSANRRDGYYKMVNPTIKQHDVAIQCEDLRYNIKQKKAYLTGRIYYNNKFYNHKIFTIDFSKEKMVIKEE